MNKHRPSSVNLALVAVFVLALLVPAAVTAGGGTSAPGGAVAEASKKKKCKKKRKKCKKKKGQNGPTAPTGPVGPAGTWNGSISSNGASVSFSVNAGATSVDNFAVVLLPVFCAGGEGLTTRVFLVPSAPLSAGSFATILQTTNDGGQVDGSMEVSGQLGPDTGSGSLRYNRAGCGSGPITWTATRK